MIRCALVGVALVGAMASGCGQQVAPTGYSMPRPGNCRVEVLQSHPGSGYVEVGVVSFDVYAAGKRSYQYTDWHVLAAELHGDICAVGGDTLMIERNAAGVIVQATVFRRAHEIELPPQPEHRLPSRSEICEPSCRAGFACEGGSCVEQCSPSSCSEGESCGTDQLCHPAREAPAETTTDAPREVPSEATRDATGHAPGETAPR